MDQPRTSREMEHEDRKMERIVVNPLASPLQGPVLRRAKHDVGAAGRGSLTSGAREGAARPHQGKDQVKPRVPIESALLNMEFYAAVFSAAFWRLVVCDGLLLAEAFGGEA